MLNLLPFFNFFCMFPNPIIFSNLNYNCSNSLEIRDLQEQVKKAFSYFGLKKLIWTFTVWINCSRDLKKFTNSRPSAWNFKSFSSIIKNIFSHSRSEQFWWKNTIFKLHTLKPPSGNRLCTKPFWISDMILFITWTIYSNSESSEQFLVTEHFPGDFSDLQK